jgi:alcohol dehydrogenase class IV
VSIAVRTNWNYPTRILFGPGRIADLAGACSELGMRRPLIVTDMGLRSSPMIQAAAASLPDTALFSEVKGNPTESNVLAGLAAYRKGRHDGVVAFGGGSGIDAGKVIAFLSGQTRPMWDFEDVGDWWTRADPAGIAPIVAVPTTAGTGSEVGRASVILNEATHQKKIIFHPRMMPGIVIADPQLTVGLPRHLTAATGLDAFVHCFEAYCAPGFHPLADGIALEGMFLIQRHLPSAYLDGTDIEARAGMGSWFDTHHGLTNAVILPYVMKANRAAIAVKCAEIGRLLNLPGADFDAVLTWILEFRRQLGVPNSLAEIGVDTRNAAVIGSEAAIDPSASGNPIAVDAPALERIFRAAVAGDMSLVA